MSEEKTFYQKFRNINERFSLWLYPLGVDQDAINAYKRYPYSWLLMLIPIVGAVAFLGVQANENHRRRRAELEKGEPLQ